MTGQSNNSQGRGHDRLPKWNPKNGGMLISQPVTSCLTNHSELCMPRRRNNQSRRISIYRLQRRPCFGFQSSVSSTLMTSVTLWSEPPPSIGVWRHLWTTVITSTPVCVCVRNAADRHAWQHQTERAVLGDASTVVRRRHDVDSGSHDRQRRRRSSPAISHDVNITATVY